MVCKITWIRAAYERKGLFSVPEGEYIMAGRIIGSGRHGGRSRKLRNIIVNHKQKSESKLEGRQEYKLSKLPTHDMSSRKADPITCPNSTVSWGLSIQISEPMEEFE